MKTRKLANRFKMVQLGNRNYLGNTIYLTLTAPQHPRQFDENPAADNVI